MGKKNQFRIGDKVRVTKERASQWITYASLDIGTIITFDNSGFMPAAIVNFEGRHWRLFLSSIEAAFMPNEQLLFSFMDE